MKQIVSMLITATLLLGAQSQIVKIDGEFATIDPVSEPIGSSGIVIHHFDSDHSTIVARAILIAKDRIRFEVYDALAQPNLPKPKIKPQPKDKVILGYLAHRGLIVAPNYQTYDHLRKILDLEWIHPDLFAVELSKAKHPAPSRADFRNFCNKFALSTVVIALKDRAEVVDCYSFASIRHVPLQIENNETKLPFYSRIKEIERSIFDFFGSDRIDGYYSYYTRLLERR